MYATQIFLGLSKQTCFNNTLFVANIQLNGLILIKSRQVLEQNSCNS